MIVERSLDTRILSCSQEFLKEKAEGKVEEKN
jgi:hypothetical protein